MPSFLLPALADPVVCHMTRDPPAAFAREETRRLRAAALDRERTARVEGSSPGAGTRCRRSRPGSTRAARRRWPILGTAPSSARVYGCCGSSSSWSASSSSTIRPAYMTSTRSQFWLISARLCEIRTIAVPVRWLTLVQQIHDLRLDRHVERGGGLVGRSAATARSSAPSRSSPAGASRPRARAGSARSCRSGVGMCTSVSRATASSSRASPVEAAGGSATASVSCSPTRRAGFSDDIGSWKTTATSVPSSRSSCAARQARRGPARAARRSPVDPARVGGQLRDRERGHRLAAARLADDADDLAARRPRRRRP